MWDARARCVFDDDARVFAASLGAFHVSLGAINHIPALLYTTRFYLINSNAAAAAYGMQRECRLRAENLRRASRQLFHVSCRLLLLCCCAAFVHIPDFSIYEQFTRENMHTRVCLFNFDVRWFWNELVHSFDTTLPADLECIMQISNLRFMLLIAFDTVFKLST
jgi:hypothetical protein